VKEWLSSNSFEVKGLFFNPNIRPQQEYEKRLLTMEHYATIIGLKVIYDSGEVKPEPGDCDNCYRLRLKKTAQLAKELGFDSFTTTLLISPYQKHDLLKKIGVEIGMQFGVEFFYRDFRVGYRESRQMAREKKLYSQKYCGCGVDLESRRDKLHAKAD
jgi:predicted adenine nucleotide alpha hydrolase (AANH) superfamily ATPase